MNIAFSWYPDDSKELFEAATSRTLLNDLLDGLDYWRAERREERMLPQGNAPTREEDCEWIKRQVLAVDAAVLPEPRRVSFKDVLNRCRDAADRFNLASQIVGLDEFPIVAAIVKEPEGCYVEPGETEAIEPGEEPVPDGMYLIGYEPVDASRLAAWLEIVRSADQGYEFDILDEYLHLPKEEYEALIDALDALEADHLEELASELSNEIEEDEDFLSVIDHSEVDPDQFVDRGLERAVNDDRAGRSMRLEYDEQVRRRDVAAAGSAGMERRRKRLDELEQRIAELRGDACDDQLAESGTDGE